MALKPDIDERADRAHDDAAVRYMDDEAEARAEDAARMDAFFEGQRAGMRGNGPNLNPFDHESPLYQIWERGRMAGLGLVLQRKIA